MAGQFHDDVSMYLAAVRAELPLYDVLQDEVADATADLVVDRVLDLGSGTGITAERVQRQHPAASLVGIDASEPMLALASRTVPGADFRHSRLEDPLPRGPFDLVVSALAVHHLPGDAKADLFARIAAILRPGGRFVLCDVVVPEGLVAAPVVLEHGVDMPDTVEAQLRWLRQAGFAARVYADHGDLVVMQADLP